jgi:hypothetical protein
MTIMLAGGMVIAAPGMTPAAHAANATLFVSAESSEFDNIFGGLQVVEIVVSDPLIASLDDVHGSPDVTVNGSDIVMAQASDGSWYAYIADTDFALVGAAAHLAASTSIDFGLACTGATADLLTDAGGADLGGESTNVWFSGASFSGTSTDPASPPATCADQGTTATAAVNIIKGAKTLNDNLTDNIGQIALADLDTWPFIQTYDFNPTGSVVIEYNKAGVNELSTLTFDTPSPTFSIDRASPDGNNYNIPLNAQIFMEIGDPMLNIDPTTADEWEFTHATGAAFYRTGSNAVTIADIGFGSNGKLVTTVSGGGTVLLTTQANADTGSSSKLGIFETGANTNIFATGDNADKSTLIVNTSTAVTGKAGTITYDGDAHSLVIVSYFGELDLDETSVGDEWNSGEALTVTLIDEDLNKNTLADEDLDVNDTTVLLVPSLQIGSPELLSTGTVIAGTTMTLPVTIDNFSNIARATATGATTGYSDKSDRVEIHTDITVAEVRALATASGTNFVYLNYDVRSLMTVDPTTMLVQDASNSNLFAATIVVDLEDLDSTQSILAVVTPTESMVTAGTGTLTEADGIIFSFFTTTPAVAASDPFVIDFFSFGDKVNNAIYRMELEESGDNTSIFEGSIDYIMTNQLNQLAGTYDGIATISDAIIIIVTEDLTDEDAPRVNYLDYGADGVSTQIADQQDAPSHSGIVDLDLDTYKIADTVLVTLTDMDLNTDSSLIDIYVAQLSDKVDNFTFSDINHLLDITFDDTQWTDRAANGVADSGGDTCTDDALNASGFTLVETGSATGVFEGMFQIPATYCNSSDASVTTTGTDIEVNYNDHRDASGETIEVGDGAGVRANTGSISLDRTVYPVPWGIASDFTPIPSGKTPNSYSIFPVHASGVTGVINLAAEQIKTTGGDVTIHIRVSDPDLDVSAVGEDKMNTDRTGQSVGPIKISITRGSDELTLAYAGGATVSTTKTIVVGPDSTFTARTMGPITEVAGDTGVFELDFTVRYTDGPQSTSCPTTTTYTNLDGSGTAAADRFGTAKTAGSDFCILQGDILTVQYTDTVDASGNPNTVTDSATFDLRNGVLQSDKSVYIIGSDMILTIIEPDWDLDNDGAETYDLDVIEWTSDVATVAMGDLGGEDAAFDPEPSAFRETGDSTGIFQIVIEIPASLAGDKLARGEEIVLEYTDWGPSGAKYVGQDDEDMSVTVYTSNFGATVELDQKVYTWTDKVYITIVAPDHNFDGQLIDTIGNTSDDPVKVSTRGFDTDRYSLVETGTDTGIFTGEIILTGFSHDSNGDGTASTPGSATSADDSGPTNGFLRTSSDDGLTVSFEYSEDVTVVGSALIRWNIGEVQWLEASYPASGTGVVRIIDPDMNLNPEAVDNFNVNTWSDSDAGGISLTVTETNEATGIFEGTVFFTTTNESSGHRLRVAEGDTVTSEYEDNTLPDPYTNADELDITATTLIGTIVPPLERAPAANLRTVDAFGNSLDAISVDQQVQISADLANGQDREQAFAYLVQIQDGNGVTVSLAWITGQLSSGQSFSPALSWIPTEAGTYTATAFVWESIDNPTALSPPVSTTISVS